MTLEQKKSAINKRLQEIYPQLKINCKKVCGAGYNHWGENLLAHSIVSFLNMDIDKQYRIMVADDAAENYITRGMAISIKSYTSSFFRLYRRDLYNSREILEINYEKHSTKMKIDEDDDYEDRLNCIEQAVKELPFYEHYLIKKHYYEGINVAELGRQLDIQPARLTNDIKLALLKMKKLCK